MLEKMDDFFEKRLSIYDEHMLTEIEGAREFYKFTASLLPKQSKVAVLDLGCGTGLELEQYFALNPDAFVTGIDLTKGMLDALKAKFPEKNLKLICGSYFDIDFGVGIFDSAVSVESLHHFTKERKLSLYKKLLNSLKADGYFVLTDYFAESEELEREYFETLEKLKKEQGINDNEFYHYDTPLTVENEIMVLKNAGFKSVEILKNWGATYTLLAKR
mgnify:CR=1 FL=1